MIKEKLTTEERLNRIENSLIDLSALIKSAISAISSHDSHSQVRHIAAVGATHDIGDSVADLNNKLPEKQEDVPGIIPPTHAVQAVGKKVDELKDMLQEHHAKSIKAIEKPVNFNFGARAPEAGGDENPEKKTANKASELVALSGAPQA